MSGLQDLYQEVILHHSKAPRNFGAVSDANHRADGHNPLCGDRVHLTLRVEDGTVQEIAFEGDGCAISTASASVMTDAVKGKGEAEVRAMFEGFLAMVTGEGEQNDADLGKLGVFAGVREFPVRVKCAMLAWRTLEAALAGSSDVTTE